MSELSATAKVILGMVEHGPKSGYEIKSIVDISTRFFWAASYGQIYPELKRLEEEGLIQGVADPQGGRQRTVYSITDSGRETLREWLTSPEPFTYELRDEGKLKFFFAGALTHEEQLDLLRRMCEHHEAFVERLQKAEPTARAAGGFPYQALLYGIRHHRWVANEYRRMAAELVGAKSPAAEREGSD